MVVATNTNAMNKPYHGCETSNYTDPLEPNCLQRVVCKWLGGDAFNHVTTHLSGSIARELYYLKCRVSISSPIELNQRSLDPVKYLTGLYIEGCTVSVIDKEAFRNMTNLRTLHLIYAGILDIDNTVFSSLRNLEHLDLSFNPIRSLALELPPKFTSLIVRDCGLKKFTIQGNMKLSKVDLSRNDITVVEGLANLIKNASELLLEDNRINFTKTFSFSESMVTNISLLSVAVSNHIDLVELGRALKGKHVETLVVWNFKSKSHVKNITFDAFGDVDLRNLVVEMNFHNTGANPFAKLTNLTGLKLRRCAYNTEIVPRNFTGIVKNLESLSLNYASLDNLHVRGLENLTELDLSFTVAQGRDYKLNITDMPYLRSLNLSSTNMSIQLRIEPCSLRQLILRNITITNWTVGVNKTLWQTYIPCLKHLDLSSNTEDIYPNFPFFTWIWNVSNLFLGLEHIEELDLYDTDIGKIDENEMMNVFRPLRSLKRLNLRNSYFKNFPPTIFENQVDLEVLDWSSNFITTIDDVVFSTLRKLHTIDLRDNDIVFIAGDAMRKLNLDMMYMTGNTFACDCDLRSFTRWLHTHEMVIPAITRCESFSEPCSSPPEKVNVPLERYQPEWYVCDTDPGIVVLSTLFSIVFCVFISLSIYTYRKRLSIRYWYVIRKLKRKRQRLPPDYEPLAISLNFDAFVHYSPQDQVWVEETFLPSLEQSDDVTFRVCTAERNFHVSGRPEVLDIMEEGLPSSSHVIFIVTNEYLRTNPSDYIMTQAEVQYLENGAPRPILVLKERINNFEEAPLSFKRLISHVVRLHWPGGQGQTDDFWKNLRLVLLGEVYPSRTTAIYDGY
jgi:Leucine-rich repeat (LRR) protein